MAQQDIQHCLQCCSNAAGLLSKPAVLRTAARTNVIMAMLDIKMRNFNINRIAQQYLTMDSRICLKKSMNYRKGGFQKGTAAH
jgi:hypothetical protein